jgi:hypothetical protein
MYYEEAVIDGVLHWRGIPAGPWLKVTPENLTAKYLRAQSRIEELERAASGNSMIDQMFNGSLWEGNGKRNED